MAKTFTTPKGSELPLLNLRGKDYLEVKYRLVWFREERPTWGIHTEIVVNEPDLCGVRAWIIDDECQTVAVSHKFEEPAHFPDFREKAETGAIGRALALLGYGTQFCADELDEGARIVDAPASRPKRAPVSPATTQPNTTQQPALSEGPVQSAEPSPTLRAISAASRVLVAKGAITLEALKAEMHTAHGVTQKEELSQEQAQQFLNWLRGKVAEG